MNETNTGTIDRTKALSITKYYGILGVHRFMAGKIGTGILYLLTLGFLGAGVYIDLYKISTGKFKKKDGTPWITQDLNRMQPKEYEHMPKNFMRGMQKIFGLEAYDMGWKTVRTLTYDELWEIIKDLEFPNGKPALDPPGLGQCIRFAPDDTYQVVILTGYKHVNAGLTTSGLSGVANMVGKGVATDDWSSIAEQSELGSLVMEIKEIIRQRLEAKGLLK